MLPSAEHGLLIQGHRVMTSLAPRAISWFISIVHHSKEKTWADIVYEISKHHVVQHSYSLFPLISEGFPSDLLGFGCPAIAIDTAHGRVGSPRCGGAWIAASPTVAVGSRRKRWCFYHQMGLSIVMGVPQNRWLISWKIHLWMIWGYP